MSKQNSRTPPNNMNCVMTFSWVFVSQLEHPFALSGFVYSTSLLDMTDNIIGSLCSAWKRGGQRIPPTPGGEGNPSFSCLGKRVDLSVALGR